MRILVCGAMLLALVTVTDAAPMTPVPHQCKITKVGNNCTTKCWEVSGQTTCHTYCD